MIAFPNASSLGDIFKDGFQTISRINVNTNLAKNFKNE